MLNPAIEELNKLIQRLEMLFQIQTHEVVQDLKRIKEMLETPVVIEPEIEIKETRQQEPIEVKVEDTIISIEKKPDWETIISSEWNISIVNPREELVKKYIEKYNKKPFGWRSNEVLQSKL